MRDCLDFVNWCAKTKTTMVAPFPKLRMLDCIRMEKADQVQINMPLFLCSCLSTWRLTPWFPWNEGLEPGIVNWNNAPFSPVSCFLLWYFITANEIKLGHFKKQKSRDKGTESTEWSIHVIPEESVGSDTCMAWPGELEGFNSFSEGGLPGHHPGFSVSSHFAEEQQAHRYTDRTWSPRDLPGEGCRVLGSKYLLWIHAQSSGKGLQGHNFLKIK